MRKLRERESLPRGICEAKREQLLHWGVKSGFVKLTQGAGILAILVLGLFFSFSAKASATTYYVDSSVTDTNVASATPDFTTYNPTTFSTSTGSSSVFKTIADINAFSALTGDDQVLFRKGQTWREQLTVPSFGTSGHPITFGAYGSGDKPIISGGLLLTNVTYQWTKSGSGTNEYYVTLSGGENPTLTEVKYRHHFAGHNNRFSS